MRLLGPSLRLLMAAGSLNLMLCWGGAAAPEVRDTQYGSVVGINDAAASGTYQWKGIPFAKPPVGSKSGGEDNGLELRLQAFQILVACDFGSVPETYSELFQLR